MFPLLLEILIPFQGYTLIVISPHLEYVSLLQIQIKLRKMIKSLKFAASVKYFILLS